MGKKTKIGKQRKDKFYFLAKEAGFRSRAAFKLLQLNKRFEFLQNSRALVDLCAAPGGWLQVAEQNMPVSSLRIGVDLVPIKPIRNCITLEGDITEEKTRHAVRKELGTWEADCVLNDGAPNVGTNWAHDAFQQNCLTLSALRLATQILRRGGYFVTKIFRSADSQSLISVFEKLFKKVHVWKPAASRLESAEIFVFCERYLKPEKVDSELLDVKKVFSAHSLDANDEKVNLHRLLLHPGRKEKKAKAIGYEEGEIGQHKELSVSEFFASKNALELLSRASSLVLDSERAAHSAHTTPEIRECLRDVKVCGPAEVRGILAWRKKLVAEQKSEERKNAVEEAKKTTEMDAEADKVEEEESKEMKELEEIDELIRNAKAEEKSKLKKRKKKLLKDKRKLAERKKLQMVHEGDTPTLSEDLELFSLRTVRKMADKTRERAIAIARAVMGKYIVDEGEEDCAEIVDDKHEVEAHEMEDQKMFAEDSNGSFKKDEWEGDQSDSGEENDGLGELDDEEGDGGTERRKNGQKKRPLTAEQLAMGEHLIHSRKKACDLEDWAWNRYTSNDDGLPDWFTSDEKKHCRLQPPVDKTRVAFYAQRDKDLNVRTIRKVVEANMRKRQRRFRKLERAKKRAEGIVANEQMEHGEKIKELKKIYKKAGAKEKKQVKYQVVTKAKRGAMTRPRGPFKLVDKRLRKDNRAMKRAAKGGGGKRMGKGGAKRPAGRRANGPSAKKKKN